MKLSRRYGSMRVHTARCDYCGRKIAWSRDRRQWLAFQPVEANPTPLSRRMLCPEQANPGYHDPKASLFNRYYEAVA